MKTDQGYKNIAPQTFDFESAMAMAKKVFDAYGSSGFATGMGGNMLCELVNLAAHEAIKSATIRGRGK